MIGTLNLLKNKFEECRLRFEKIFRMYHSLKSLHVLSKEGKCVNSQQEVCVHLRPSSWPSGHPLPVTKGKSTLFEQTYIIIVSSARLSLKVRRGKCVVWQTTRRREQWRPHKRQASASVANKCRRGRRQALSFVFTALRKELRALMNLQSTLEFVSRTQVSTCQSAVRTPTLRKQIYKTKINFLLN